VRLTIYTSSSDEVGEPYRSTAAALGERIASRRDELIYGGTAVGLMGVLSAAVRGGGGRVTGVLPQLMADRGIADDACDELVVTDGMAGRKQVMMDRADAFVALPGGFGTLEELFEVLTLKQLGYHRKPIVLMDVAGFFAPLLGLFRHLFERRFANPEYARLYEVVEHLDDLFTYLDAYEPEALPTKWF